MPSILINFKALPSWILFTCWFYKKAIFPTKIAQVIQLIIQRYRYFNNLEWLNSNLGWFFCWDYLWIRPRETNTLEIKERQKHTTFCPANWVGDFPSSVILTKSLPNLFAPYSNIGTPLGSALAFRRYGFQMTLTVAFLSNDFTATSMWRRPT